jgi:galactose mutarotase-like enzyme
VTIPDHGDFWRLPCAWEQNGQRLRFSATGKSLPLFFERVLHLEGDTLRIEYMVRNDGDVPADYIWSAHPLFAVDEGDRILLPPSADRVSVENSGEGRLGEKGTMHSWPWSESSKGERVDLSLAGGLSDGVGDKLFAAAPPEGWAAVERKRHGLRIHVEFHAQELPFLGLWLCYGGWPPDRDCRQHCVAIEPCIADTDSLTEAIGKGRAKTLAPAQLHFWKMQIHIRDIS